MACNIINWPHQLTQHFLTLFTGASGRCMLHPGSCGWGCWFPPPQPNICLEATLILARLFCLSFISLSCFFSVSSLSNSIYLSFILSISIILSLSLSRSLAISCISLFLYLLLSSLSAVPCPFR